MTGTYLGALSHTLTALAALRERAVPLRGIVVSESADSVGLAETVEGLRDFGAADRPDLSPAPAARAIRDADGGCARLSRGSASPTMLDPSNVPPWYDEGLPHVWLPYCQMKVAPPPLPVVRTHGCRIVLADGRELIDGIASWWSVCHGYNHPYIREAVERQLATMPHVMFGGLVHEPALTLATRLDGDGAAGTLACFFADSGSIAVEVALKIALQYWLNKGQPGKDHFLCFTDGYHGDTLGAMAVSDPERVDARGLSGVSYPAQSRLRLPARAAGLTRSSMRSSATWHTRPRR